MLYFQVLSIGFIVTFMNLSTTMAEGEQQMYINIDCTVSGKGTILDPSCFINSGSLNFIFILNKKVNQINLNLTTFYQNKQNARPIQVFKIPPFDFCKSVKKSTINPMLNIMLNFVNDAYPGFIHECPYQDELKMLNFRLNQQRLLFFPSGYYRTIVHAYNDDDENLITVNAYSSVNQ